MANKLPYINILQSAMVIPPAKEVPFALDLKILPDKNVPAEPFFGVWLLDISGSMAGDRLNNAKESLADQIKFIPDGSIFTLITFETEIHEIMVSVTVDNKSRPEIVKNIQAITDRGTTALYSAVQKGIELVRNYKGNLQIKKIVLISDGDPTDVQVESGNQNDPNYQKYFLLAKEAREYKASIDCVGALGEHNVFLMYELSKQSTGKYIFAENEEELKTKMLIATEQTVRIAFSQPSLICRGVLGKIELDDAAQFKPTVIRMPFEKMNDKEYKTFFRSFEAGDSYQFLIKGKLHLDPTQLKLDMPNKVLILDFDFGKGLKTSSEIQIKFTNDQSKFKLNQDINKNYANIFSQAEEIADCTIRGDAAATQKIQGDETKKIKG